MVLGFYEFSSIKCLLLCFCLQSSDQEALEKSLVRCDDSVGNGEV